MGQGQTPWIAPEMCFSPRRKSQLLQLENQCGISECVFTCVAYLTKDALTPRSMPQTKRY